MLYLRAKPPNKIRNSKNCKLFNDKVASKNKKFFNKNETGANYLRIEKKFDKDKT